MIPGLNPIGSRGDLGVCHRRTPDLADFRRALCTQVPHVFSFRTHAGCKISQNLACIDMQSSFSHVGGQMHVRDGSVVTVSHAQPIIPPEQMVDRIEQVFGPRVRWHRAFEYRSIPEPCRDGVQNDRIGKHPLGIGAAVLIRPLLPRAMVASENLDALLRNRGTAAFEHLRDPVISADKHRPPVLQATYIGRHRHVGLRNHRDMSFSTVMPLSVPFRSLTFQVVTGPHG